MDKTSFSAQTRTVTGKAVKRLRAVRQLPGNISTPDGHSVNIAVSTPAFSKLYDKVGDTGLIYLTVDGEKEARPVLVDDIQVNPLTSAPLHVVFRQVNLKEKISAEVPVEIVGETSIPDTVIITVHDSIEVEALPANFPDKFVIEASVFTTVGQMVTFADLKYDKSQVTLLVSEEEMSSPVAMLQEVKEQVEPEPTVEATPEEGAEVAPDAAAPADAEKPAA